MKKLLYTLLAVSLIFTACEKEEEAPTNNNSALAIGDTHQGGIIFYLDANSGGLIAAPYDQEYQDQSESEWGCQGTAISGADGTGITTGSQNTIDIEAGCITAGTAADICANLTIGGYSDWFLPSKDELNEMYLNISYGSALGNVGNFVGGYWSSTEFDDDVAWYISFLQSGSVQGKRYKNSGDNVRAVRAF